MDVDVAIKIEAWAVAEGLTVDTVGSVEARILRSLRGLAGVAGFGGLMHWNNEVIKLLQTIAESAGSGAVESVNGETGAVVLTAADIGVAPGYGLLTAAGVSAGTSYEVTAATSLAGLAGYLQLKRAVLWDTSRAIAAATPEYGWTWKGTRARISAASNDNTTNADASTWVFDATSCQWYAPNYDAPYRCKLVNLQPMQSVVVICRVASNADATFELGGIMVVDANTDANWSRLTLGYDSGGTGSKLHVIRGESTTNTFSAALTAGDLTAGVWLRMVWSAGQWLGQYSLSTSTTPPSTWTSFSIQTITWGITDAAFGVYVGMMAQSQNTSATFVNKFLYWDMRVEPIQPYFTQGGSWGTRLLDTTGTAQLVGEYDFGGAVSLDQTKLRLHLADAVNTRLLDSAPVTWSVVGGASPGVAAGSYAAAASVTVSGSYRYWAVYAKITSADGTDQGSIRLPLLLPAA